MDVATAAFKLSTSGFLAVFGDMGVESFCRLVRCIGEMFGEMWSDICNASRVEALKPLPSLPIARIE